VRRSRWPSRLRRRRLPSEDELQPRLHNARVARAGQPAELPRRPVRIRRKEISAVEEIENLPSELEPLRFGDVEFLECREIHVGHAGRRQYVSARIAMAAQRGKRILGTVQIAEHFLAASL